MAHPEYIYYALLALLVFPSLCVNRMAVVVVLCWLPGQILTAAEALKLVTALPPEYVYIMNAILDSLALLYGMLYSRNTGNLIVTILFLPLVIVNAMGVESAMMDFQRGYGLHPYYVWWLVFWFASAQAVFIPLGNNWRPLCKWLYAKGLISDPNANFHFFNWDAPKAVKS